MSHAVPCAGLAQKASRVINTCLFLPRERPPPFPWGLNLTQRPRGPAAGLGLLPPFEFDPCHVKGKPFGQVSSSGVGIPERVKVE